MAGAAEDLAHTGGPLRMVQAARQRFLASGRTRAVALLLRASPRSAVWLALWTIVTGLLPVLTIVTMGITVGRVPAAARGGLGSPAGHALIDALVATSVVFLCMLAIAPVKELLSASLKVRLTYVMQQRLAAAVSTPTRIKHLEDPAVLDRLALAQGSLTSYYPADAPVLLAGLFANQLTGITACVVIGWFRWWLGLLVFSLWTTARRPLRRDLMNVVRSFGGESDVMRRSEYFRQLATRPLAAKELRVFGLEDWVVDSFRTHWLEGMTKVWKLMNRLTATMARVSVQVVIVYGLACFVIARAVLDHSIGIGMVATLLPLLMSATLAGTLTPDQVALEFTSGALPHLDEIEHELSPAVQASDAETSWSVAGHPSEQIRFAHVAFQYPGASSSVFHDLELELPSGTSTAIVGPNGVGKTTLVKLLAGLHVPSQGEILVDGTPLHAFDPAEWQRNVAVVFQDFIRYPLERGRQRGVRIDRTPSRRRSSRCGSTAGRGTRDHRAASQGVGHDPVRVSTATASISRAGSGSGSRSPERSSPQKKVRTSWYLTSRQPGSTREVRPTSSTDSWRSPEVSRPW